MERAVILTHKKLRREFIISNRTKPQGLRGLARRALNLTSEIRWLKHGDTRYSIEELIARPGPGEFEVVVEEESEEERPLSEVVSQKNMSRVSGRKNPPSEK